MANRTGQTFTTVAEASREIERLKQAQPATRLDNRLIDREIADAMACGDADATRVRSSEVSGHGSSATWAHHREPHPPAATRPVDRRPLPTAGQRTELARYTVAGGERVLYGPRVDGVVRFLPREGVVLVAQQGLSEDDACLALVGYRASPHALTRGTTETTEEREPGAPDQYGRAL